jgi:hypothetical protein
MVVVLSAHRAGLVSYFRKACLFGNIFVPAARKVPENALPRTPVGLRIKASDPVRSC